MPTEQSEGISNRGPLPPSHPRVTPLNWNWMQESPPHGPRSEASTVTVVRRLRFPYRPSSSPWPCYALVEVSSPRDP